MLYLLSKNRFLVWGSIAIVDKSNNNKKQKTSTKTTNIRYGCFV
jgi:hypothetical protein